MVEGNENTLLNKATSQKSESKEANPYNMKKDYIDYDQQKQNASTTFQDANTIAVKKDPPKVVVDSMSMQYLTQAEIDYESTLMGSEFKIRNPNVTATCGCGSSFTI